MISSTWVPVGSILAGTRGPSVAEDEAVERVYQLCRDWRYGMSLDEVRQYCTPRDRWTATRFTPADHSMFRPLMDMLDALIATDVLNPEGMLYQTPQGTFSEAELRANQARWSRTQNGSIRILFPVLWPWDVKPDRERNEPGIRGSPVYGDTAQERDAILSNRGTPTKRKTLFE